MKKFLAGSFLSIMLATLPVQNTQAAVGALTALFNPAIGANIALGGLAVMGAGTFITLTSRSCDGGSCMVSLLLGFYGGMLLLDNDTQALKFGEVKLSDAEKLGVSEAEVRIYNQELEEANLVLEEVSSNLDESSSNEEVSARWEDVKEVISPATFKVMQAIVTKK